TSHRPRYSSSDTSRPCWSGSVNGGAAVPSASTVQLLLPHVVGPVHVHAHPLVEPGGPGLVRRVDEQLHRDDPPVPEVPKRPAEERLPHTSSSPGAPDTQRVHVSLALVDAAQRDPGDALVRSLTLHGEPPQPWIERGILRLELLPILEGHPHVPPVVGERLLEDIVDGREILRAVDGPEMDPIRRGGLRNGIVQLDDHLPEAPNLVVAVPRGQLVGP